MKEKILVSACLIGTPCRYDGKSKPCSQVAALKDRFDFIPVCPEVMGGLSTPRLPCEIQNGLVIRKDGQDLTSYYQQGARAALKLAKDNGCKLAILKEKSPSCGTHCRYDGTFSGTLINGRGLTAELLAENGIRILSENETEHI